MSRMREHYGKDYAANSRETIRRQTVHQFEQARLVDRNPDDPTRPTNSGDTVYQLFSARRGLILTRSVSEGSGGAAWLTLVDVAPFVDLMYSSRSA